MNVAIFKQGQTPQYLQSINGAEYLVDVNAKIPTPSDPDVLINPDISSVSSVPLKFWKRSNNSIIEMNQAEKDAILSQEVQARKNNADTLNVTLREALEALIKVINLRLPSNKITKAEMITAIKEEIS